MLLYPYRPLLHLHKSHTSFLLCTCSSHNASLCTPYTLVFAPLLQCHDGKRVAECLKRCGRITGQCMDATVQVQLLIEVLNFYILFYEKGNSQVLLEGLPGPAC